MKLNLGALRLWARNNRTDRVRLVRTRSYAVVLVSALFPLTLFFMISFSQISKTVLDSATVLAEMLRDARGERIATSVRNAFENGISSAVYAIETGTLTGYNAPDTVKPLTALLEREPELERITLYDAFFEPLAAERRDGDLAESELYEEIRLALQDIRFETDRVVLEVSLSDATSRLVMFARISTGTRVRGYVTIVYNYEEIVRLISAPVGARVAIYNGRYQLIADSFGLSGWKMVVQPLTERMLDGFTETLRVDTDIHAFGFIDFTTTELFVDVAVPLTIGSNRLNSLLITFIILFVVTAGCAIVVAWLYAGSVIRYGESILIRGRFTKEMRLLSRFGTTLESVRNSITSAREFQVKLDELGHDISAILDEMPPGESEDDG